MTERSMSDVLQEIFGNLQEIIRAEVRLARAEVREDVSEAAASALWLAVGALSALSAWMVLLWAAVYGLAFVMPMWAATLVVAVAMGVVATVLITTGLRKFKRIRPIPERTVQTMKEHVAWIKQSAK